MDAADDTDASRGTSGTPVPNLDSALVSFTTGIAPVASGSACLGVPLGIAFGTASLCRLVAGVLGPAGFGVAAFEVAAGVEVLG